MLIDAYRFFLHHLPLILLSAPVVYWAYREFRTERQWRIAMIVASSMALVISAIFLASLIPDAMRYGWSGGRLAPAAAWVNGYRLYYPRGQGPVLVQMYGPVSAMVYLPAVLFPTPTSAMLFGSATNLLFFLPAAWFLKRSARGQGRAIILAAFAVVVLVSGRQFVLQMTSTLVTIDAPAIGFATCALAVLAAAPLERLGRAGVLCGIFAALSAWTKLTTAPVVVALCIYAILIASPRKAMRFILCMAAAGIVISSLFLLSFGPELLFQNVVVPSRQPWEFGFLGRWPAYQRVLGLMWHYSLPASVFAIGAILFRWDWPGFHGGAWREWAARSPWLLPALAAITIFPTSSLAYVKVGGIWNNAAACTYMALLSAAAALSAATMPNAGQSLSVMTRMARVALPAFLLLGSWTESRDWKQISAHLVAWSALTENEHEAAFRYALKHPGVVYFPSHPFSTLLAEHKAYHFSAGIDDLDRAGFPLTDEHLRRELPARMQAIILRSGARPPLVLSLLPEFKHRQEIPDLPGWVAMTRDGRLP